MGWEMGQGMLVELGREKGRGANEMHLEGPLYPRAYLAFWLLPTTSRDAHSWHGVLRLPT